MKNIIHIYGASGSGTTTLAKALSKKTGYRFMDSDDYFWEDTLVKYTVKRPVEQRTELMKRDLQETENAVISGSLTGWGDVFIQDFTLVIRLVVPTEIRIERLKKREYEHFGDRILPGGDMEKVHVDFIEWAKKYDSGDENMRSKAHHDLWQQKLVCPQLVLDGTRPVDELVELVLNEIKKGEQI